MTSDKAALYSLVAELRGYGFPVSSIAKHLRISARRIEQVIADLRQPPPPFESLPTLLRERIEHFAKRNESATDVRATA